MRVLLLLTVFGLTACSPVLQSGELAVSAAPPAGEGPADPDDPDPADPFDPAVVVEGVDFGPSPSLWFTQHDDGGWMLMISQHPDFCGSFQIKTSFDDGDLCDDGAKHPTTLYMYGIPESGGEVDASDMYVRLVQRDPEGGCTWHPRSFDGGLNVFGSGADARGSFDFDFETTSVSGAFSAPQECPGIPDWF